MTILIPILVLTVIGILAAALLTLAAARFGVKEDARAAAVRECLPGANCGACGYSGCDGYAGALAEGKTDRTNLCVPGGDGAATAIAAVLGVEAQDVVEQVAYVACKGSCAPEERKYHYEGVGTCRAANIAYNGDRFCTFACLGYGDCAAVCPQGAVCIENGVAHVDPRRCVGCGMCVRACPNGIIHLVRDTVRVAVKCSNRDKGAAVRKICANGCIACGKCEKNCPSDAIHVRDGIAAIDYDRCTGCGLCRENCPVHCIAEGNFLGATHDAAVS